MNSAAFLPLPLGVFKGKLRKNLRSRGFSPQLHPELEHQGSGPEDAPPKPQGPSLLTLQALQELDLTACSKLTDASLAKVWIGWGSWGWRQGTGPTHILEKKFLGVPFSLASGHSLN